MKIVGYRAAVLVVLAYSDQFRFALSFEEIWNRLPSRMNTELTWDLPNRVELQMLLEEWCRLGLVLRSQYAAKTYYYLTENSHPRYRFVWQRHATLITRQVTQAVAFMRAIPWVVAVGLTGSLAMKQYKPGDDLDFFVVTQPNTLWLTRLIIVAYTLISGHRRGWEGERHVVTGRTRHRWQWCMNMWMEAHDTVPRWSPSLYTAYELNQVKWLFDKQDITSWIYHRHQWVQEWLPHAEWSRLTSELPSMSTSWLIKAANTVVFWVQRMYMLPHMTTEKVSLRHAFFHPRSTQHLVQQGWQGRLRSAITRVHVKRRWSDWQLPHGIKSLLAAAAKEGRPVILVTGVFDIWHQEHQRFLEKAQALGGILIAGVESDHRVREMKGEGRPINNEEKRRAQVQASGVVSGAFVLPEVFSDVADYRAILQVIRPRYLAVSSHSKHQQVKQQLMEEVGGSLVVVHHHNPAVSTTLLLRNAKG